MLREPAITIEGVSLTIGQAMTVRVAVTQFLYEMSEQDDPLGSDTNGRAMAEAYKENAKRVLDIMLGAKKK